MSSTRPVRVILVGCSRVRPPERDLVDPVRLADQAIGQAERLEHLDGAAGDAVGLADLERPVPAIDDRGRDVGERGQLRGEDQAGRTAPDDQDVDVLGKAVRALRDGRVRLARRAGRPACSR